MDINKDNTTLAEEEKIRQRKHYEDEENENDTI